MTVDNQEPISERHCLNAVPLLHAQLGAYRSEIPHLKKYTELAEQPIPREASDKIAGNTQPQRRLKSTGGGAQSDLAAFAFSFTAFIWAFALSLHAF